MPLYTELPNDCSTKPTGNTCSGDGVIGDQSCDLGLCALQIAFNTIDEPLYIVDLESYKIIFVNTKIEALFGPVKGKFCWEKLQKGQTGPCDFCTNKYLLNKEGVPSGVHHSTYKNQLSGKWFQCSDQALRWFDGRMVAIKTSVDVSTVKENLLSSEALLRQNKKLCQELISSIDNERRQLSQDLHDELGQIGTAIRLNADFLLIKAEENTEVSGDQVDAVKDIIKLSEHFLSVTKSLSVNLNPRNLILHQSVQEMFKEQFGEWLRRNRNIKGEIVCNCEFSLNLDITLKETLYRVMQEALTNISRHSKATYVRVLCSAERRDLFEGKPVLKLIISDDGMGFPDELGESCSGLLYMQERLALQDGYLEVNSSCMGGGLLEVTLPYTVLDE